MPWFAWLFLALTLPACAWWAWDEHQEQKWRVEVLDDLTAIARALGVYDQ